MKLNAHKQAHKYTHKVILTHIMWHLNRLIYASNIKRHYKLVSINTHVVYRMVQEANVISVLCIHNIF